MKKHPYFSEPTFDKSYRAVTRSFKLKPNEKALISHVITWQETTDKDGKPLNKICFESNPTLSEALGIPLKTLEPLITKMNREYDFFSSKPEPGLKKSKRGGNLNRTFKKIDMVKLAAFLEAEEAEREAAALALRDADLQQSIEMVAVPEVAEPTVISEVTAAPIEPLLPPKGFTGEFVFDESLVRTISSKTLPEEIPTGPLPDLLPLENLFVNEAGKMEVKAESSTTSPFSPEDEVVLGPIFEKFFSLYKNCQRNVVSFMRSEVVTLYSSLERYKEWTQLVPEYVEYKYQQIYPDRYKDGIRIKKAEPFNYKPTDYQDYTNRDW